MNIKRKNAAYFIDRVRVLVAEALGEGRETHTIAKLQELIEDEGLTLPTPCTGEAHSNGHFDNCGKCLKGLDLGWVGERVKVK